MSSRSPSPTPFDKYRTSGAYHWAECDRRSRSYNPSVAARYEIVRRRVVAARRVLDVGCGDGYLMGRVQPQTAYLVGVDSEFSATSLSREMLADRDYCDVVTASSYELPFPADGFDRVLLTDVIEHLEEPTLCLSEVSRVLAPGGTMVLTTPKSRPDRVWDPRHVKEYRPDELAELLARDFADVEMSFFWPLWWSNVYRTKIGWRLVKSFARHVTNPFLREGTDPASFGQILAVCRKR
jgi:2-polyprenyl-3-methyl-5-hydroxy-6-metoxy-1,4-benzoquinol methylase